MGKIIFIEATDLGDAWFQALYKIMTEGRRYLVTKGSYEGTHRSGATVVIDIRYPGTRPLSPQMPGGSNIPAPTTEEDIEEYSTYLMTPIKQPGEHYTYGEDLCWQIEWVIKHYQEAGYGNNHCYMTVGRPETLLFYDLSVDYNEVIVVRDRQTKKKIRVDHRNNQWNKDKENRPSSQCLRGIDTWIDEGKLHFWVYFRSWDHWGGFPVNLGGIQLMKEYMAGQIGVEDGPMIVSCKDLHIYEHAEAVALMRLGKGGKKEK
jgi:thymidylate synthase